jgi:hypothetical protein
VKLADFSGARFVTGETISGLDGIAMRRWQHLSQYVTKGEFFRVETREGKPGKVTRLTPSRPLKYSDGMNMTAGRLPPHPEPFAGPNCPLSIFIASRCSEVPP